MFWNKNPDVQYDGTDLENYINSYNVTFLKKYNLFKLGFCCTKVKNSLFHSSLTDDKLEQTGLLLREPVCEYPKPGIFKSFYEIYNCNLVLSCQDFNIKNLNYCSSKKFNDDEDKKIIGIFSYKKKELQSEYELNIQLYNFSQDYLKNFNQTINEEYEVYLDFLIQKLDHEVYKFPIVEISLSTKATSGNHKFVVSKEDYLIDNYPLRCTHRNLLILDPKGNPFREEYLIK